MQTKAISRHLIIWQSTAVLKVCQCVSLRIKHMFFQVWKFINIFYFLILWHSTFVIHSLTTSRSKHKWTLGRGNTILEHRAEDNLWPIFEINHLQSVQIPKLKFGWILKVYPNERFPNAFLMFTLDFCQSGEILSNLVTLPGSSHVCDSLVNVFVCQWF